MGWRLQLRVETQLLGALPTPCSQQEGRPGSCLHIACQAPRMREPDVQGTPLSPRPLASSLPAPTPLRAPWHARWGVWMALRWVWGTACILCGHRGSSCLRGSDLVLSPCPFPEGACWVVATPPLPPSHLLPHPTTLCVRTWYGPNLAERIELRDRRQGRGDIISHLCSGDGAPSSVLLS